PELNIVTCVSFFDRGANNSSIYVGWSESPHSNEIRWFNSTARTMTFVQTPYISQSHRIASLGCSLPVLFVNQNFVVISGLTNASNTSVTGLLMSISVFTTVSFKFDKLNSPYA